LRICLRNGVVHSRKCRTCERAVSREQQAHLRATNNVRIKRIRANSHARMRYGFTQLSDRDTLLAQQGNSCAICGRTGCEWGQGFNDKWHVDHDHTNPEPNHRGVLCGRCNLALGHMEQVGLEKFTAYLEAHK
jgi:hypothetical protein